MEKYISRTGCNVFYRDINQKIKKTVIFIHGYGIDSSMWDEDLSFFNDFRLIVPDVRAHGKSRPLEGKFTVKDACDDIAAIIEKEKIEDFVLVGLSLGGYIVQDYSFYHGGAKGYMIIGSTPIMGKMAKWEVASLGVSDKLFSLYKWPVLKREMAKISSLNRDAREKLEKMFSKMTMEEFVVSWKGICNCLHREETFSFDAPTLVLCGASDHTGTIKMHMKDWEKDHANVKAIIVPNSSHLLNMDRPEYFHQALRDFLQERFKEV